MIAPVCAWWPPWPPQGKNSAKDFMELKVWQKAYQLVLAVYRESVAFPTGGRFGLTAHLRKTALSIPSSIADWCDRQSDRDLARFLSIAADSANERDYRLLLACDLDFPSQDTHRILTEQVAEVSRMLCRSLQSLEPDT